MTEADAQRIAHLEKLVEEQGLALSILATFVSSQHDLFDVYVDGELRNRMMSAMRRQSATGEKLEMTKQGHSYVRSLLRPLK